MPDSWVHGGSWGLEDDHKVDPTSASPLVIAWDIRAHKPPDPVWNLSGTEGGAREPPRRKDPEGNPSPPQVDTGIQSHQSPGREDSEGNPSPPQTDKPGVPCHGPPRRSDPEGNCSPPHVELFQTTLQNPAPQGSPFWFD